MSEEMASLYISDYLRESIASRKIRDIRGALLGYVEMDPAFKTSMFQDAINYVIRQGFDVYVEHDTSLYVDPNCPDKDRFYQIQNHLHYNFSKERVMELVATGRRCMINAPVYTVTDTSLGSHNRPSYTNNTTPRHYGDEPSKKTPGQDQRMASRRIWTIAAAAAILAIVSILIILLKKS